MKNDWFTIGPLTIHGYGVMIAIGVMAAFLAAQYKAKRLGLNSDHISSLTIWCLLGGILGAKLLYLITQIGSLVNDPKILLNVTDGYVVYGGIIGGILTGFLYCKRKKLNFLQCFDLLVPSVALAQGFGRLGCLMAGCCYGNETNSWFGIEFPASSLAPSGIRLVPIQLIASGLDFILFTVLILFARRKKVDGQVAALYLILYSAGRFGLEFFRGDVARGSVGVLSTSQFIAIFLFIIGCSIYFFQNSKRKRKCIVI